MSEEEIPVKIVIPPGGSTYNYLFGDQSDKLRTVAQLLGNADFGRFRDSFVEQTGTEDEYVLAVYARIGGANRQDYPDQLAWIQNHPLYLSDADDSFDETYAMFRFRINVDEWIAANASRFEEETPWDEFRIMLNLMSEPPVDMTQRWKDKFAELGA